MIVPMAYLCKKENENFWKDMLGDDNANTSGDYLRADPYINIARLNGVLTGSTRIYRLQGGWNGVRTIDRENLRQSLFSDMGGYPDIQSFFETDENYANLTNEEKFERLMDALTDGLTAKSTLYEYVLKTKDSISDNGLIHDRFLIFCEKCFDIPNEVITSPESAIAKAIEKKVNCMKYIEEIKENAKNNSCLLMPQLYNKFHGGVKQIILHGAPGTGKTFTAEKFADICTYGRSDRVKTVQFHPTYDYTDLVEGLRPVTLEDNTAPTFVRMDGTLKEFCRNILEEREKNPDETNVEKKPYFFIIDEINRADLSKVLGDLMYLMNDSSRSHKEGEIKKVQTPYRSLPTYHLKDGKIVPYTKDEDVFYDGFYLPDNLYIIGTMNDIDRSVDIFDFALRRRFCFIKANANEEAERALPDMLGGENTEKATAAVTRLKNLNGVITKDGKSLGLSDDYHIGHAYLGNIAKSSYEDVWENNICPLIREYCRGRNKNAAAEFENKCKTAFTEESENKSEITSESNAT